MRAIGRFGVGFRRHPDARRLDAYVDGRLPEGERARIAEHLTRCDVCRRAVAELRRVGELARAHQATVPALPPAALERVLARRAAGERCILPTADAELVVVVRERGPRAGGRTLLVASAAAAAAAIAITTGLPQWMQSHLADTRGARINGMSSSAAVACPPGMETDSVRSALIERLGTIALPVILTGCAKDSVAPAPRITSLDGGRVAPVALHFRTHMVTDSAHTSAYGESELAVSRGSFEGRDVWVVSSSRVNVVTRWRSGPDTLYLDPATLVARRTVANWGGGRFEATFDGDLLRVAGMRPGPAGHPQPIFRSYRLDQRIRSLAGPTQLDLALQAIPLAPNWSGSFPIASAELPMWFMRGADKSVRTPPTATLRVVGEERVTVPAGSFDCWKVQMLTNDRISYRRVQSSNTLWVAKSSGWIVRRAVTEVRLLDDGSENGTVDFVTELLSARAGG
ncbi:MAG TPA: zf-HC2 domain-containing protein [Gemmatimonadaceae bacterium]|nr:zf-HC2 domain-containing protein [Gemmatimonadaceae bacterium]